MVNCEWWIVNVSHSKLHPLSAFTIHYSRFTIKIFQPAMKICELFICDNGRIL
jgi:hypothetical protein